MTSVRVLAVLAALALVLGGPFAVRAARSGDRHAPALPPADGPVRTLVVVTPHVPQIQQEFGAAFARWHRRVYHEDARIDWRAPGGTSEILKQLEAQYTAAFRDKRLRIASVAKGVAVPDADTAIAGFDLMLGGGTFEHSRLKRGIEVEVPASIPGQPAARVRIPMSTPAGFSQDQLTAWYAEPNRCGSQPIYDPDQYWLGTALSGFGIVFNRDVLRERDINTDPSSFKDLTDHRYAGLLALADPRQSGSVTTTLESILNKEGWDGWRTLRELSANARYFSGSASRPPLDVSAGEAAAGLAIDFYGRGQSQTVMRPGETPDTARVGYVDPKGAVYIDADPVSILLGTPNADLARRFIEFTLTEEAQALWQFPPTESPAGAANPPGPDGRPMGPSRYALRRMPVRRVMYDKYADHFVDKTNPFDVAADLKSRGWRDSIAIMMGAFGIDTAEELKAAWAALTRARTDPAFPKDTLAQMEQAFYAMPMHQTTPKDGQPQLLEFSEANFKAISDDTSRWRDPAKATRARIAYTRFFLDQYQKVVDLEAHPAKK
jgi:ABC-type Fe3+ transport system substrate-binding protein